jgi:hypothetical protein
MPKPLPTTLGDREVDGTPLFARCRVCGREVEADAEVFDAMLSRADEARKSDRDCRQMRKSRRC